MTIESVVLAAGFSARAGCYKMTLKIGDLTVIEKCIEGMYDQCSRIIVVAGYRAEELRRVLSRYSKVEIVINENYPEGMFSSVKKGASHVRGDRFFLTPGDCPFITKAVYEKMALAAGKILIPVYNGKGGHPVLMNSQLAEELSESLTDSSLKDFMARKGYTTIDVNDPGILFDIDTIEDYQKAQEYSRITSGMSIKQ